LIPLLSFATISLGVLRGAPTPPHAVAGMLCRCARCDEVRDLASELDNTVLP